MIDYAALKSRVTMPEAAVRYGLVVERGGMAVCPFHREKTASLKLYPDGFYCFGCGAGGDVVNFAARLFNLPNHAAAEKLDEDFGLGLSGRPYNAASALRREEEARHRQAEKDRRAEIMRRLLAKRRCLWINRFDRTGHNAADMAFLDYVIDNFEEFPVKEAEEIARRFPCIAERGQHLLL